MSREERELLTLEEEDEDENHKDNIHRDEKSLPPAQFYSLPLDLDHLRRPLNLSLDLPSDEDSFFPSDLKLRDLGYSASTQPAPWAEEDPKALDYLTPALKRLLSQYLPHALPSSDSPELLVVLLQDCLEQHRRKVEDLRTRLKEVQREVEECRQSSSTRYQALVEEHKERLNRIIHDHELQLTAAVERAMNARRQASGLQSQLAVALSRIQYLEGDARKAVGSSISNYHNKMLEISQTNTSLADNMESLKVQLSQTHQELRGAKDLNVSLERELRNLRAQLQNEAGIREQKVALLQAKLEASNQRDSLLEAFKEVLSQSLSQPSPGTSDPERVSDLLEEEACRKQQQAVKLEEQVVALNAKIQEREALVDTLKATSRKRLEKLEKFARRAKEEKTRTMDLKESVKLMEDQMRRLNSRRRELLNQKESLEVECLSIEGHIAYLTKYIQSKNKLVASLERDLRRSNSHLSDFLDLPNGGSDSSPLLYGGKVASEPEIVPKKAYLCGDVSGPEDLQESPAVSTSTPLRKTYFCGSFDNEMQDYLEGVNPPQSKPADTTKKPSPLPSTETPKKSSACRSLDFANSEGSKPPSPPASPHFEADRSLPSTLETFVVSSSPLMKDAPSSPSLAHLKPITLNIQVDSSQVEKKSDSVQYNIAVNLNQSRSLDLTPAKSSALPRPSSSSLPAHLSP